jgi:hypothetical protein
VVKNDPKVKWSVFKPWIVDTNCLKTGQKASGFQTKRNKTAASYNYIVLFILLLKTVSFVCKMAKGNTGHSKSGFDSSSIRMSSVSTFSLLKSWGPVRYSFASVIQEVIIILDLNKGHNCWLSSSKPDLSNEPVN